MKRFPIWLLAFLVLSCTKDIGASDKAMKVVENRFNLCHLKDSLRESEITYLWSEYDSKYNSILCFQYGGCAIEYYYHTNEFNKSRDTFIVKKDLPIIDDLKNAYRELNGEKPLAGLNERQESFLDGFSTFFKDRFSDEEDFIDGYINGIATNSFIE